MTIRWLDNNNKWVKFSEREINTMGIQNAKLVLTMLSSFRPVVIEHNGKYITDHEIKKELEGPCVSFQSVINKIPPTILFKELMQ